MNDQPREGETLDAMAGGGLRLFQRQAGYRFNLDAVLLAGFALAHREADRPARVIDLGAGSGVVALLVAAWRPAWQVTAVEVQPSLADLARRNIELNNLPVELIEADWRSLGVPGRMGEADLVVCNPPYFAVERGQPCPDTEKAAARHEVLGTIADTARAARRLVQAKGSARFIYAASRLLDLIEALAGAGLPVVRLRLVHAKARDPAYAVLVESLPDSRRPLTVDAPLVVHSDDGGYSPEVAALLAGNPIP
jgi:tRNA1Val (adenine37-N6)-methyltransferase